MPQPLHPALVHFPIVLIITALIFHILYLLFPNKISGMVALIQLTMGVFSAFISVWTGEKAIQIAQPFSSNEIQSIAEQHEFWANLTIWIGLVVLISWIYLRLKYIQGRWIESIITIGLIILTIIVIKTAFFGAELVYTYHVFILSQ
jgi:uncharacterized membrane protein